METIFLGNKGGNHMVMKVIKHSHVLPGSDVNILANLAQSVHLPPIPETYAMIDELSCVCTKQIAKDILAFNIKNPAAKAFLDWVDSLDEHCRA